MNEAGPGGEMSVSPKVSVIVPMYKVEPFVRTCLESVERQSFRDFECLIIDDGSPDGSSAIAREFEAKDPRFRLVSQENKGISGARNAGIEAARGGYLYFLDSDDYVHPQLLELCVGAAEKTGAQLAAFLAVWVEEAENITVFERHVLPASPAVSDAPFADFLQKKRFLPHDARFYGRKARFYKQTVWSKLYHKSLFQGLRFEPRLAMEDTLLAPQVLYPAKREVFLPFPLYFCRRREGSLLVTTSVERRTACALQIVNLWAEFEKSRPVPPALLPDFRKMTAELLYSFVSREPFRKFSSRAEIYAHWEKVLVRIKEFEEKRFPIRPFLPLSHQFILFLLEKKLFGPAYLLLSLRKPGL